jgi:hypothetical protein
MKKLFKYSGKSIADGLCTIVNSIGHVIAQNFTQSSSASCMASTLHAINVNGDSIGAAKTKVVFVDNCCQVRQMLEESIPSLKTPIELYPPIECDDYTSFLPSNLPDLKLTTQYIHITERATMDNFLDEIWSFANTTKVIYSTFLPFFPRIICSLF